jgi:hypothetical protein
LYTTAEFTKKYFGIYHSEALWCLFLVKRKPVLDIMDRNILQNCLHHIPEVFGVAECLLFVDVEKVHSIRREYVWNLWKNKNDFCSGWEMTPAGNQGIVAHADNQGIQQNALTLCLLETATSPYIK